MLYILTPTGNRQAGMIFLSRYIKQQNYMGELHWIIVDDCDPPAMIPKMACVTVEMIRPRWRWHGENTQAKCMAEGLKRIPDDASLIIMEDDDVYLPDHISNLAATLENYELVGEKDTRYYNVATRRCRIMPTSRHSSLCSVGVRGAALKRLKAICSSHKTAIDSNLWRGFKGKKILLDSANVVGIKGLPGRKGIGVGHSGSFGSPDVENMLSSWIGEDRASVYQQFRRDP